MRPPQRRATLRLVGQCLALVVVISILFVVAGLMTGDWMLLPRVLVRLVLQARER